MSPIVNGNEVGNSSENPIELDESDSDSLEQAFQRQRQQEQEPIQLDSESESDSDLEAFFKQPPREQQQIHSSIPSEPPSSGSEGFRIPSSFSELEATRFDLRPSSSDTDTDSHHTFDEVALQTFLYPTNKPIRDYQRNIVRKALVRNLICALPTGLGKTFIASVVMLNWLRWTTKAKIIFVAPTRPLVAQQAKSFLEITGVSINDTAALLQGIVDRNARAEEWTKKRVFFATAQTIANDLDTGIIDPKEIVLLVLDEAHRATGNHAYVNVVEKIYSVNPNFRLLALTATPSGYIDGVQLIIDTLHIAQTEIRTEESLDIQKYTHTRNVEKHVVEFSEDQELLLGHIAKALKEQTELLCQAGILYTRDITNASHFGVLQSMNKYMASQAARHSGNRGRVFMIRAVGGLVAKIVYATGLLKTHGIYPFYERMRSLKTELDKSKGMTARKLLGSPHFSDIYDVCERRLFSDLTTRERVPTFIGHPKLAHLVEIVSDFFLQHGADSRAIIFSEFRESGTEIIWVLERHCPQFVRASMFVGQAAKTVAGGETVKGMTQKQQHALLDKFKAGDVNVLVATSIAEEGLDIGQVDLIICYDQSKSPIRMVQRMGRTGRQREGHVHMLMTEKEKANMDHAVGGHKYIRKRIDENGSGGGNLNLKYHPAVRILPRDASPKYSEVLTETPPENEEALAAGDILVAMKPPKKSRPTKRAKRAEPVDVTPLESFGFQTAADLTSGPSQSSDI